MINKTLLFSQLSKYILCEDQTKCLKFDMKWIINVIQLYTENKIDKKIKEIKEELSTIKYICPTMYRFSYDDYEIWVIEIRVSYISTFQEKILPYLKWYSVSYTEDLWWLYTKDSGKIFVTFEKE